VTEDCLRDVKIVSGGQTGVDRAALDIALKHGIECGGWCPAGRVDEFGRIPDRYPLKELARVNKERRSPDRRGGIDTAPPSETRDIFAERTFANVRDSDGTIIICDEARGGTAYTLECCKDLHRPHQVVDASRFSAECAATLIAEFVRNNDIEVLNIAGPRQSEWAEGYDYAFCALEIFVSCSHRPMGGQQ
jgi:hypothetical protein